MARGLLLHSRAAIGRPGERIRFPQDRRRKQAKKWTLGHLSRSMPRQLAVPLLCCERVAAESFIAADPQYRLRHFCLAFFS